MRARTPLPDARPILAALAVGALALACGGAAGGILAEQIAGSSAAVSLPVGAMVTGAGAAALPLSKLMLRAGRARGLQVGYQAAAAGAGIVFAAALIGSLWTLVAGHLLIGAGNTAVMLSRYAVADLAPNAHRAQAMGSAMLVGAAGAVAGPALLGPTASASASLGLPPAAGLYAVSTILFLTASALVADKMTAASGTRPSTPYDSDAPAAPSRPGALATPLLLLASANLTMVSIMAVTPVHLHHTGTGLGQIGLLLSAHIAAMFATSRLTGRLVDRFGARPIAGAGTAVLLALGGAPLYLGVETLLAAGILLVVLGAAWNFVIVSGSALLTAAVHQPSARGAREAHGEIAMSVGAAVGCLLLAGPLMHSGGLPLLAAATMPASLASLLLLADRRLDRDRNPLRATTADDHALAHATSGG